MKLAILLLTVQVLVLSMGKTGQKGSKADAERLDESKGSGCVYERESLLEKLKVNKLKGMFVPKCTISGDYEAKQFHGSTGHSWCVDPQTGKEIFGTRRGPGEGSQDLNCTGLMDTMEEIKTKKIEIMLKKDDDGTSHIPELKKLILSYTPTQIKMFFSIYPQYAKKVLQQFTGDDKEEIMEYLGKTKVFVCDQKFGVIGDCRGMFPSFSYNKDQGKCEEFNYGGCGGNDNRFDTLDQCQALCEKNIVTGPAAEDGSKDATDYYDPHPYDPCLPPPYRCPRVCRGQCCSAWGCTGRRPYTAEMSQGYHGPPSRHCGQPPYICPSPCRDPCCSQWGCTARHPYSAPRPSPRCGPPPYICPSPCRDPCCETWGCY